VKIASKLSPIVILGTIAITLSACSERPEDKLVIVAADSLPDSTIADIAPTVDPILANGKRVFSSCAGCHTVNSNGGSLLGPNLWGIVGSVAGSKKDYIYSDALKNSGVIWNLESLGSFIENPASFLPGGNMAFEGVTNDADREALLAYMVATLGPEASTTSEPTDQGKDSAIWE